MSQIDASLVELLSQVSDSNVVKRNRVVNVVTTVESPKPNSKHPSASALPLIDAWTDPRENLALDVVLKAARNAHLVPPRVQPRPEAKTESLAVRSIGVDLTADVATVADGLLMIFLHMKQKYVKLLQNSGPSLAPAAAVNGGPETAAMVLGAKLERTSQLAELRELHERAKEGLTVMVQKVIFVEGEMKSIVIENGRVKTENAELKKAKEELENAQRKLDLELQGMRRSIYKLVEMRQISDEGLAILDAQKLNANNEKTGIEILKAKTQAKESKFALKKLEQDLKNRDSEINALKAVVDAKSSEISGLNSTVEALNAEVATLQRKIWDDKNANAKKVAAFDQFVFKEKYNQKSQTDPWTPEVVAKVVYRDQPKPILLDVAVITPAGFGKPPQLPVSVQTDFSGPVSPSYLGTNSVQIPFLGSLLTTRGHPQPITDSTTSATSPAATLAPGVGFIGQEEALLSRQQPGESGSRAREGGGAGRSSGGLPGDIVGEGRIATHEILGDDSRTTIRRVARENEVSIPPMVSGGVMKHVQTEFSKENGLPMIYRRLEKLASGSPVKYGQLRTEFADHMEEMVEAGLYRLNEQAKSLDERAEELIQPHLLSRFIALVEFHHEVQKIEDEALRDKLIHIVAFLQKDLAITISHICKFCRRLVAQKDQDAALSTDLTQQNGPLGFPNAITRPNPRLKHVNEQKDVAFNALKAAGVLPAADLSAGLQILGSSGDFASLWRQNDLLHDSSSGQPSRLSRPKLRLGNFGRLLAQKAADLAEPAKSGLAVGGHYLSGNDEKKPPVLRQLLEADRGLLAGESSEEYGDDESGETPRLLAKKLPVIPPRKKPLKRNKKHMYTALEVFPSLPEILGFTPGAKDN